MQMSSRRFQAQRSGPACSWLGSASAAGVPVAAVLVVVTLMSTLPSAQALPRPTLLEHKHAPQLDEKARYSKRLFSYPTASERLRSPFSSGLVHSFRRRSVETDQCEQDATGNKTRVCRNCAKITRARGAYDECCSNVANAYSWCKRVFDFTSSG